MTRSPALVLTPRPPWPLADGGLIGLWQFTWSVAQAFDTTLVSLYPAGTIPGDPPPELAGQGARVVLVPHSPPSLPVALLRGQFGRWPYTLTRYRNRRYAAALRQVVREARPAFALINHLHLATYADALDGTALVLRQHNVECVWLERYAETLLGPARAYARGQAARMRAVESRLCERMDLVLAIHEQEAATIRAMSPRANVEVVPVGVDFARFREPHSGSPPVVLLAGSLAWPPNDAGARRFVSEGWPRVRARIPGARLRIVGKGMSEALRAVARSEGVEPVGYVDDIAEEFAAARVMVVPLWAGAGMRVKIVEAMAARLAVVSTPLGAEGLGIEPGRHIDLADTPAALADAVAALLERPERAAALSAAARDHAAARWSLDGVAARTRQLCERAVELRARRGGSPVSA